jgi:FkbM family methyltransferase
LQCLTELEILQRQVLSEGDTFIDIGANHGSYSLIASNIVGKTGRVYSVEPRKRLAKLLEHTASENSISNLEVFNFACSDKEGLAELLSNRSSNSGSGSLHASNEHCSSGESVSVTTLDKLILGKHCGGTILVKIDVEGHELFVIRGGIEFIRTNNPLVVFELNPTRLVSARYSAEEIIQELTGVGYRRFSTLKNIDRWVTAGEIDFEKKEDWIAYSNNAFVI